MSLTPNSQGILQAALQLPEADRVQLVEGLLESFGPNDEPLDESWAAELDQRLADFAAGRADGVSWAELKREA